MSPQTAALLQVSADGRGVRWSSSRVMRIAEYVLQEEIYRIHLSKHILG